MSNDRSPREVCSITMGINGLMSGWLLRRRLRCRPPEAGPAAPARPSSATGGPQFRLGGWLFLVGRPDGFAGSGLLGRDALDLDDSAVEGAGKAHAFALRVVRTRLACLLDDLVRLFEAVAEGLVDLLVRNLDPELVGGGFEHELTGDRCGRLVAQAPDQILG